MADWGYNPFTGQPVAAQPTSPVAPTMSAPMQAWNGDGALLTPEDQARLAAAPKRAPGTEVTARSYNIPRAKGWMAVPDALTKRTGLPISPWIESVTPSHMYLEYDDGKDDLIARGGPSAGGVEFPLGWLNHSMSVTAQVTPAELSKDNGQGQVIYRRFLPDVSAAEAARPARWTADRAARGGDAYDWSKNSNSYAADALEETTGDRIRTPGNWGADAHIVGGPPLTPQPDLAPYLRAPW